jgi:hypothetical protein
MRAAEVARALGKARREGRGWRTECPVHHGFSLNIADGRDGRLLITCWAGCTAEEVFAELRRLDLLEAWRGGGSAADDVPHRHDDVERRIAIARRLWDAASEARRGPLERYFTGRGLALPASPSLRWAPRSRLPRTREERPAMVARVDNVDGEFVGISRTYLTPDFRRLGRAFLGPINGGAVRLGAPRPDGWLIVGEGIETVVSVMQVYGLPGWTALSANGLRALVLPRQVRMIVIAADNDTNGVGEAAARDAAERWAWEGRQVRLMLPAQVDSDFNDELRGGIDGQRSRQ